MKKNFIGFLIGGGIALIVGNVAVFANTFAPVKSVESDYTLYGGVVTVNRESNLYTVLTEDGNLWYLSDPEDIIEDDILRLTLTDSGTLEDVTDDVVTGVRYIGYGNWRVFLD